MTVALQHKRLENQVPPLSTVTHATGDGAYRVVAR
jgi:hypothetical protein